MRSIDRRRPLLRAAALFGLTALASADGALRAQRAEPAIRTTVPATLFAHEVRPSHGSFVAPRRVLARTGPDRPETTVPHADRAWWIRIDDPELTGTDLSGLVDALVEADARPEGLVLRGCAELCAGDLASLAALRGLRTLDLDGCAGLGASGADDALRALERCVDLEMLSFEGTGLEPADVRARLGDRLVSDALARTAEEAAAEQRLTSLAWAVFGRGRLLHADAVGSQDVEAGVPASALTTRYRWASISKPVTAAAAMQLFERGLVDLDADVRGLVPEFPAKEKGVVTLRQLLGHLGGVVHYSNGPVVVTERDGYDTEHPFADVVTALDRFGESPLVDVPGRSYNYTTHGYILASAVVQRAGDAPFWRQVRERIAQPVGMATFRPDYQWESIPDRAVGYRRWLGVVHRSTDTDVSWKLGGGGFLSSVVDLARFGRALVAGELTREDSLAMMRTRQATSGARLTGYGLGLSLRHIPGVGWTLGHGGAQEKTRTYLLASPDHQVGVALMTNAEWARLSGVADAMLTRLVATAEADRRSGGEHR